MAVTKIRELVKQRVGARSCSTNNVLHLLAPTLSLDDSEARLGLISLDLINTYSAFTGIADIESQDQYAFIRDAYLDRRKFEVNDGLSEEDLSQDEDFEDF